MDGRAKAQRLRLRVLSPSILLSGDFYFKMQLLNSTQIPNNILEAIFKGEFTLSEQKVLLLICRKTIGWQKETDWMTHNKIAEFLGMTGNRGHISHFIHALLKKKAIIQEGKRGHYFYSLNFDKWGMLPNKQHDVTESVTTMLPNLPIQKILSTKDTNTKDVATHKSVASKEIVEIIKLFEPINLSIGKYYGNKSQRAAVNRMLVIYGRAKLEAMILALPQVNTKQYWPKSTTPCQLENNLPIYKAKNDEEKLKVNKKIAFI